MSVTLVGSNNEEFIYFNQHKKNDQFDFTIITSISYNHSFYYSLNIKDNITNHDEIELNGGTFEDVIEIYDSGKNSTIYFNSKQGVLQLSDSVGSDYFFTYKTDE
jgi:hypothetical protein